ncbi:hypothetical protein BD560DRAFT_469991 [Blakeslea trispora]|nr:hypothetical protein BD560DRAFT_469991 [Blakeslea trispora]
MAVLQTSMIVSAQSEVTQSIESVSEEVDYKMAQAQIAGQDASKIFSHLLSDIHEFIDQVLHPILTIPTAPPIVPTVPIPIITFPPASVPSTSVILSVERKTGEERPTLTIPPFSFPAFTRPTQPPISYQAKEKRGLFNLASDLAEPLYREDEEINLYFAVDDEEEESVRISSASVDSVQSIQVSASELSHQS